jgi:hypothetical protein
MAHWWVFVNMMMKFRVHERQGISCTGGELSVYKEGVCVVELA